MAGIQPPSLYERRSKNRPQNAADNVGIIAPNYNVAPGDPQPVIRRSRDTGERELVMMRWGIVPWFAKSELEFKKLSTINAKSDRLTGSKMWREPFAKRRCLVPPVGSTNGCDLKVVPMIVRSGHTTGPAVPSAVP